MNYRSILPVLILALASLTFAQEAPQPAPPPQTPAGSPGMTGAGGAKRQKMMEMHKQHMAAMQADLDKMKAALEQMKTNVGSISDAAEKARWQSNVDLWTVMVGHMEQMMKHMNAMGPGMGRGMMRHGAKGGPPPAPPKDMKAQ